MKCSIGCFFLTERVEQKAVFVVVGNVCRLSGFGDRIEFFARTDLNLYGVCCPPSRDRPDGAKPGKELGKGE